MAQGAAARGGFCCFRLAWALTFRLGSLAEIALIIKTGGGSRLPPEDTIKGVQGQEDVLDPLRP
jgi:hypothetical protein